MQDMEQAIRERAYHLWVSGGCRDGNADAYWLMAQREVLAASLSKVTRASATTKTATAKKKAKATVAKARTRAA